MIFGGLGQCLDFLLWTRAGGVGKKVVGFPPVPFLAQMLPLEALLVWDSS